MLSLVVLSIAFGSALAVTNNSNSPFCKLCICSWNHEGTYTNVSCTKPIPNYAFENSSWIENDSNKPYEYTAVSFQNNHFNNLSYVFPRSNLIYFNLAHNDIFRISDSVFRNLQNMVVLILSYNDLEIIHPDAFKGVYMETRYEPLRSLKELRLDHNKLHTLNQDMFEHTTDIEILDLSHNPIEIIDDHTLLAIDSLAFLKELYLQYTELKTLPDNLLHTPKYLKVLDLSGNTRINKIPDTIAQAGNLEKLFLNNTGFINLTQESGFPKLKNLKVLHLCRNQHLSHIEKHSLCNLVNLEELYLCDNIDLTYIDPMALALPMKSGGSSVWPPIKKLYIGNNKLAYLDSDIIARWDSLSELDIRDNPWTCECENQWLIDDLVPRSLKINENMTKEIRCAAPIEMKQYTFYDLYEKKSHMRCLDMYGATPEKDAAILVGVLAGVLITIPVILFLLLAYQRRWFSVFGFCDNSPAAYSRRFYKASATDDNF
ncbi:unnamed protein product [Phaedon cochleariae]|uniref:Uncharacterized protein n=1 Tax=Phaedon cochleariae TaxID=80249 RepID=A0A9N9SD87_PHACE|nr:unnamed protein product [Phaedon cochleariae]